MKIFGMELVEREVEQPDAVESKTKQWCAAHDCVSLTIVETERVEPNGVTTVYVAVIHDGIQPHTSGAYNSVESAVRAAEASIEIMAIRARDLAWRLDAFKRTKR